MNAKNGTLSPLCSLCLCGELTADEGGRTSPAPSTSSTTSSYPPHRAASPFRDLKRWDEVIENIWRLASKRTDFLNVVDVNAGY